MKPVFLTLCITLHAAAAARLSLEPNEGQGPAGALYLGRLASARLTVADSSIQFGETRMEWIAPSPGKWEALEDARETRRYCLAGLAPRVCHDGVAVFRRLVRRNLYPGIDWVIYEKAGRLEYDLVVAAGASPDRAVFRLSSSSAAEIDANGDLRQGSFVHRAPRVLQEGRPIESSLRTLEGGRYGFELERFDRSRGLTIDPIVEWARADGEQEGRTLFVYSASPGATGATRIGTTRSADWRGRSSKDVFIATESPEGMSNITYWGGSGDEEPLAATDLGVIWVAGVTKSVDAVLATNGEPAPPRSFGGEDGFLIGFPSAGFTALTFGGPGDDRITSVNPPAPNAAATQALFVTGGTTDPAWLGRGGSANGNVAFAGYLSLTGGAGSRFLLWDAEAGDRISRAVRWEGDRWALAGETVSGRLPGHEIGRTEGVDAWVAIADFSEPVPAIGKAIRWGGPGTERVTGVAVIDGSGIYLAGTTDSTRLPAASNTYAGGASDGYLLHLDPVTLDAVHSVYLGGPGRDEILFLRAWNGDLALAGATDSSELALPGEDLGSKGGVDMLFVHATAAADPMYAMRAGGKGDDRAYFMSPAPGSVLSTSEQAFLCGETSSREWLQEWDGQPASELPGGVSIRWTVPTIRARLRAGRETGDTLPVPPYLTIGRDLSEEVIFRGGGGGDTDGLISVSVNDPAKATLTTEYGTGLAETIAESSIWVDGLADSGGATVTIRPRTRGFPIRKLRVRLAPSALFLLRSFISAQPGDIVPVEIETAPVLGSGRGRGQNPRRGISANISLRSASATDWLPRTPFQAPFMGRAFSDVTVFGYGSHIIVPSSPVFLPAMGQQLTVQVERSYFPSFQAELGQYHSVEFRRDAQSGDRVQFESLDPSLVCIAVDSECQSSVSVTIGPSSRLQVRFVALGDEGQGTITMRGTLQGRPVESRYVLILAPSDFSVDVSRVALSPGEEFIAGVRAVVRSRGFGDVISSPQLDRATVVGRARLRSSNPNVLRPSPANPLRLIAGEPGEAVVTLEPTGIPGLDGFRAVVRVLTAPDPFPLRELEMVEGTQFVPFLNLPSGARARTEDGNVVRLVGPAGAVTDSRDYAGGEGLRLQATGRPGQSTNVRITLPGGGERSLAVSIAYPLYRAGKSLRITRARSGTTETPFIYYTLATLNGPLATQGLGFSVFVPARKVAVISSNPEVCAGRDAETGDRWIAFALTCFSEGETVIRLTADWLPPQQADYPMVINVIAAPRPVPQLPFGFTLRPISLGQGLQQLMELPFDGTCRSSDPARLRIGASPGDPGSGECRGTTRRLYLNGLASDGVSELAVTSPEGAAISYRIYHYPSTLTVRTGRDNPMQEVSLREGNTELTVSIALADGASKSLLPRNEFNSQFRLRAGTDPQFVTLSSSNENVLRIPNPRLLIGEGWTSATLPVTVTGSGDVTVTISQPDGFTAFPASSLRVRVPPRNLSMAPGYLGAGLQTSGAVEGSVGASSVTIESLSPDLTVSASPAQIGAQSVTIQPRPFNNVVFYAQARRSAPPGERLKVRFSSPGAAPAEAEFRIARVRLEAIRPPPLSIGPAGEVNLDLALGPSVAGTVIPGLGQRVSPGESFPLEISSDHPEILLPLQDRPDLAASPIRVRPIRPGRTTLRIKAPPEVDNGVEELPVEVQRWATFIAPRGEPFRWMSMQAQIRNPRPEPTRFTLSSEGAVPVVFGSLDSTARSPTLGLTLEAGETRNFVFEPGRAPDQAGLEIRLRAEDFNDTVYSRSVINPEAWFAPGLPATLSLDQRTLEGQILLGYGTEIPLGQSAGPSVIFQIRSSNAQVVAPGTVEFRPGESRKAFSLRLVGRGDTVLTIEPPSSMAGTVGRRAAVNVR